MLATYAEGEVQAHLDRVNRAARYDRLSRVLLLDKARQLLTTEHVRLFTFEVTVTAVKNTFRSSPVADLISLLPGRLYHVLF